ncbi:MAG TPA: hypothetical protein VLA61_20475 [Ideonella sp.]|uniref:hypothetical protein n=1 Tax=Ideonella sp. TaxID=1929293 RepID=UPI002BF8044C|nr:hypothetical protein [Ideonella sp.]HSI50652.1 hypothetical protein [Ideonella sp.]
MTATFNTARAVSATTQWGVERVGFAGLALVMTFSVLAALSQIADRQVDEVTLANAARFDAPAQVVVIVGKRVTANV